MSYFGGKGGEGVYQTIINEIPPHKFYREPFLGGGSIMKKIKPAKSQVGYELNTTAAAAFRKEMPHASVFESCGIEAIEKFVNFERDMFLFIDPPYPWETRKSNHRYKFELTALQHKRILTALQQCQCNFAITTYPNTMYSEMLKHCRLVEYTAVDRRRNIRQEHMFCNYEKPIVLHDDRYLGENKDMRQRIKRQTNRLASKVTALDQQHQSKLIKSIFSNLQGSHKELLLQELNSKHQR